MMLRGGAAYYKTALVALLALLQSEKVGEDRNLERTRAEKPRGHKAKNAKKGGCFLFSCFFFFWRWKACKTDELEEIRGVEATTRGFRRKERRTKTAGEKKKKSAQINEQYRDQSLLAPPSRSLHTLTHTHNLTRIRNSSVIITPTRSRRRSAQ